MSHAPAAWRGELLAQRLGRPFRGGAARSALRALRVGIEIETCVRTDPSLRLFVPVRDPTIRCADGLRPTEYVLDYGRAFYVVPGRRALYEKVGEDRARLHGGDPLRDVSDALEHDIALLFQRCDMCELWDGDASTCALHVHMSDPRAGSRDDPTLCDLMTYQLLRLWVARYEEQLIGLCRAARAPLRVKPRYSFVARRELTPTEQVVAIRRWRPTWDRYQTLNIRGKRGATTDSGAGGTSTHAFRNTDGARVEVRVHDDMLRTHRTPESALAAIGACAQALADMFLEADRCVTSTRVDERAVAAFRAYARGRARRRPCLSQLPSLQRARDEPTSAVHRERLRRQIAAHPDFSRVETRRLFAASGRPEDVLRDAVRAWEGGLPPRRRTFDLILGDAEGARG